MRVFHDANSVRHDPTQFFRRGTLIDHPEQPARYTILRDAVLADGHELVQAPDAGLAPITAVHDPGYVAFLREVWDRRAEVPGIADEILTGHFARPQMYRPPQGLLGLVGYYLADTSTPIRAGTWSAVYGAAQVAIAAADAARDDGYSYALCRPPGHHAYANSAGGFCYLNNTSIAAERLRQTTQDKVAILDIDVHHGNGTQGIFYERADVFTQSIHGDPANYFPFYAGYADETGSGAGLGFNRNWPLPQGTEDDVWLRVIADALDAIGAYRPAALVVALGLDASGDDPIGCFKISRAGFDSAARAIASLGVPTVIVQEGGYLCEALPRNLSAFLSGFEAARQSR
jgi:acetoin utilization deacetylase AcuC-like enzyme